MLTIFAKKPISDVRMGSKYASVSSCPEVFPRMAGLNIFANFKTKHLGQNPFLLILKSYVCKFAKNKIPSQVLN